MKCVVFLFLVCAFSIDLSAQQLVGGAIFGEETNNQSGYSIALSDNGSIVAIGALLNDGSYKDAGHVRVFQLAGDNWVQLGSDIDGENANDFSGRSIALSGDGKTIVIGANLNDGSSSNAGHVRIFSYKDQVWTQVGADIDGDASTDQLGYSVDISKNGIIVAVGAIWNTNKAGQVKVFELVADNWVQRGGDIIGETEGDLSAYAISLSSDGNRVAIGAIYNEGDTTETGHVRVFEYQSGSWSQLGDDIDGTEYEEQFGSSVAISGDGNSLVAGARFNDQAGNDAGQARIFRYSSGSWTQLGQDLQGENSYDQFGNAVSISENGEFVMVTAPRFEVDEVNVGKIYIYTYDGTSWNLWGNQVIGQKKAGQAGFSSTMSSDGSAFAFGSPYADTSRGLVKVYKNHTLHVGELYPVEVLVYPNPARSFVNISTNPSHDHVVYTLLNGSGHILKEGVFNNELGVDIKDLSYGVYMLQLEINGMVYRQLLSVLP